ncbi:MAG: glycosyltransferase family 2 protein [Kiritimatiellaeota bacterium]|nr:glycosyltransferase family 2 protein [Kiritimatiellota bacterium]
MVIPAYNEEARLPQTLARVCAYLAQARPEPGEVLVVDDGSRDGTVRVAEAFAQTHPAVRVIRNDHRGKGYAVRAGMLAARGRTVLFTDADLSAPIEDIELLLPWFERGYDIVIGSRMGGGADLQRVRAPLLRRVMGRAFNWIVRLLAVHGIHDTQCGFKAFRDDVTRDVFTRLQLYGDHAPRVRGGMMTAFDVEVLFVGRKLGYHIREVPVHWSYGRGTKIHLVLDSWRNFRDVVLVRWNDLCGRYRTPAP